MGSVINTLVGYELTFYIIAGILAVACVFCFLALPNKMNKVEEKKEHDEENKSLETDV